MSHISSDAPRSITHSAPTHGCYLTSFFSSRPPAFMRGRGKIIEGAAVSQLSFPRRRESVNTIAQPWTRSVFMDPRLHGGDARVIPTLASFLAPILDRVELLDRRQRFPSAFEAGRDHEGLTLLEALALAVRRGELHFPAQQIDELLLRLRNRPFAFGP